MKKGYRIFSIAFLGLTLQLTGCQSKTPTPSESTVQNKTTEAPAGAEVAKRDNALVRLVNARDDQIDLYFGDTKAFAGVDSQKVTAYSELPAERHEFKVLSAGKDASTIASNSEGLSKGAHYTAVAFRNKDGSNGITLFPDDLTPSSNGKARVRIVNVATGVDEVDIYPVGQKAWVEGVNFNSATSYKEVDPTVKALEVHRKGDKQVAARVPDLSLSPGKTYTIFVLNDRNALKVIPVEDQLVS